MPKRDRAHVSMDSLAATDRLANGVALKVLYEMHKKGTLPATVGQIQSELVAMKMELPADSPTSRIRIGDKKWRERCSIAQVLRHLREDGLARLAYTRLGDSGRPAEEVPIFGVYLDFWGLTDCAVRVHELGWGPLLWGGERSAMRLLQAHAAIKRVTGHQMKSIKERLWHPQGRLVAKQMAG